MKGLAAAFACRIKNGWAAWENGEPPCLAVGPSEQEVRQAMANRVPDDSEATALQGPPNVLEVTIAGDPGCCLPDPILALRLVGGRQPVVLRVKFVGHEPLANWGEVTRWVSSVEKYVRETASPVGISFEIETALETVPSDLAQFALRRPWWFAVCVRHAGVEDVQSRRTPERAARLADLGIRVRALLSLTRRNVDRWEYWADRWLAVTHGAGVGFARPDAPDPAQASTESWELPDAGEVASFLLHVYDGNKHDLWQTAPYDTMLFALTWGLHNVARCGSDAVLGAVGEHLVSGCRYGLPFCCDTRPPSCECRWAPLCDAVCAPCSGIATVYAGSRAFRTWERLFCPAVQVLAPRFLQDLADAAVFSHLLAAQPADRRFRAAVRNGQLKGWTESVITDHRLRSEGHHGGKYDLSWVRTRTSSSGVEAGSGAASSGHPTQH